MAFTYAEILSLVQEYTENTETSFVAAIPHFVELAEEKIQHVVQLPVFRKTSQGTLTTSNRFLDAPSDFISMFSLAIVDGSGDHQYLIDKDVNFLREAFRDPTATGTPRFYALWDDNTFLVAPTPSSGLTVEINYQYKPESIVTASTSWLGNYAQEALLYGTLVEAYIYMKGEEDILKMYEIKYQSGLKKIKQVGDGKNRRTHIGLAKLDCR